MKLLPASALPSRQPRSPREKHRLQALASSPSRASGWLAGNGITYQTGVGSGFNTDTFFNREKTRTPKNNMRRRWKTGRTALKDASGSGLCRFPGSTAPSPGWPRPLRPAAGGSAPPPESISPRRPSATFPWGHGQFLVYLPSFQAVSAVFSHPSPFTYYCSSLMECRRQTSKHVKYRRIPDSVYF